MARGHADLESLIEWPHGNVRNDVAPLSCLHPQKVPREARLGRWVVRASASDRPVNYTMDSSPDRAPGADYMYDPMHSPAKRTTDQCDLFEEELTKGWQEWTVSESCAHPSRLDGGPMYSGQKRARVMGGNSSDGSRLDGYDTGADGDDESGFDGGLESDHDDQNLGTEGAPSRFSGGGVEATSSVSARRQRHRRKQPVDSKSYRDM